MNAGQIVNMKELAQAALDNWDLNEMRPASRASRGKRQRGAAMKMRYRYTNNK